MKILILSGFIAIFFAILLSESRTGLISIIIGSTIFFQFNTKFLNKTSKIIKIICILILILLCFGMYIYKKDSVSGRFLVWKVSFEMIKNKPFFGYGQNGFTANYMNYQAEYFSKNPNSKYSQYADNIIHSFNEFFLIAIKYGLIIVLAFSVLLIIFLNTKKYINPESCVSISILSVIFIFSLFSYPLNYPFVWIVVLISIVIISSNENYLSISTPKYLIILILIASVFLSIKTSQTLIAELKWREEHTASNKGNGNLKNYEHLYNTLEFNHLFLEYYAIELNYKGEYEQSNKIILKCIEICNIYNAQLCLSNNYIALQKYKKAESSLLLASNMIPSRFVPLYKLFELYKTTNQKEKAIKIAQQITEKPIKIRKSNVYYMKDEAEKYLNKKY